MSTPRDLLIVAWDFESNGQVRQGDLSLALAGAELIDLLSARTIALDGDRVVPGPSPAPDDPLLQAAASSLVRKEPYESVDDWLWRRGRDLTSAYVAALEAEAEPTQPKRSRRPFRAGGVRVSADSPDRRRAADRWAWHEPVLAALAAAVGIHDESAVDSSNVPDDVTAVLAAVGNAEMELEAVRQRRTIEDAAFDNIWRG
ncbi:GPP34 family phosphoprotein [Streptomyces antnestii]|uniref:GPP34 family phosphoprotein n=1 Tax=Streptomyces antnestii TaxID=2494256 RepID=A0A437P5X4_9ACTN|nr:GPP34 family phosphoprotein [Streptomyces sp. San01]RVU17680.1 GPP34 family phosphoprotein [Streptomyces sp. San01]